MLLRRTFLVDNRDPFSKALGALRSRLRDGDYVQGEPLKIVDLARELGSSATPVREALSRLAGQGLIEDRRGRGYFAHRLDGADLIELYDLNLLHLTGACEAIQARKVPRVAPRGWAQETFHARLVESGAADGLAEFMELLFERLIADAGSRALMTSYRATADRLRPASLAEADVVDGVLEEGAEFAALFDSDEWTLLLKAIRAYHDRRRDQAAMIINAMRARSTFQ